MGSQRRLIEDLEAKGIKDPPIQLVHAIERLRNIGDDVSGLVYMWMRTDREAMGTLHMGLSVTDRLAEAAKDLNLLLLQAGFHNIT